MTYFYDGRVFIDLTGGQIHPCLCIMPCSILTELTTASVPHVFPLVETITSTPKQNVDYLQMDVWIYDLHNVIKDTLEDSRASVLLSLTLSKELM